VHLISLSPDAPDPLASFKIINQELGAWSPALATFPQIVVLNKIDVVSEREELELWRGEFAKLGVQELFAISGLSGEGLGPLMGKVANLLALPDHDEVPTEPWSPI
jgi:GTP-binding protein